MNTRVIKQKVFFVTMNSRTFKYTEVIEEIIHNKSEIIDLTEDDDPVNLSTDTEKSAVSKETKEEVGSNSPQYQLPAPDYESQTSPAYHPPSPYVGLQDSPVYRPSTPMYYHHY